MARASCWPSSAAWPAQRSWRPGAPTPSCAAASATSRPQLYTFAYFGDLASREIERAQRHHRPFALLTLHFGSASALASSLATPELSALRKAVTQALLSAVRESDVVARVDDDEQYLLLPETGRLGALSCRRRILERLRRVPLELTMLGGEAQKRVEEALADVSVGVSVFPVDGRDLGELLKLSRKRCERTRHGDWQRLGLDGLGFWESVEQLLVRSTGEPEAGVDADTSLPPEAVSRIALALIRDAQRERIMGTLYLAGDAELSAQVARQVLSSQELLLRTWLLGPAHSVRDPAAEIRLPLSDSRLKTTSMVLWMTERGGYCLLGSQAARWPAPRLPLVRSGPGRGAGECPSEHLPLAAGASVTERSQGRVLVVDADYNTLGTLARALRARGHHVTLCTDGRTGLQRAVESAPDVVLVDRDISVVDAQTFLDVLRDNPRTTSAHAFVLSESGKASGSLDSRCEVLVKPFHVAEVVARIEAVLRVRACATPRARAARRPGAGGAVRPAAGVLGQPAHRHPARRDAGGQRRGRRARRAHRGLLVPRCAR